MTLHIYSPHLTARFRYTAKIMFSAVIHAEYQLHDKISDFQQAQGAHLNYSETILDNCLHVVPAGLISQPDIRPTEVPTNTLNGMPVLFSSDTRTSYPFDVFSAVFYMASLYEEYSDFEPDKHGRFPAGQSLAFRLNIHRKPIVHYWVLDLANELKNRYGLSFRMPAYSFLPTYDIDNAYAHLHKSAFRTYGSLLRTALTGRGFREKINVLAGLQHDPYDNYDYLEKICSRFHVRPAVFMLTANKGKFDRNISPHSPSFSKLVRKLQSFSDLGIHPSYRSAEQRIFPASEIKLLEGITNLRIKWSRQHYLKLRFPDTYELLEKHGIKKDFTLGYAECGGFRSGMTVPYPFFNLKTNSETHLVIQPFCFMESAYQYYDRKPMTEIGSELSSLIREARSVGGVFCPIWHNESLGNTGIWKGWRELHDRMYEEAIG